MKKNIISVSARKSPLSLAQAKEVEEEIQKFHHHISFKIFTVESHGDKDKKTSLRSLDKTDFFTREIDELVINRTCQIAIHSAKDLPEKIPEELSMIALTKGLTPSDSLVLREGEKLRSGSIVATSSERREELVREICPVKFVDIRGTIGERLDKLKNGEIDGIVIAEAALIRLGLTHLNRIHLNGPTVPFQGQLAIMARKDNVEMRRIFTCVDSRS